MPGVSLSDDAGETDPPDPNALSERDRLREENARLRGQLADRTPDSGALLAAALEQSPVGLLVVDAAMQQVRYANAALAKAWGLSPEAVREAAAGSLPPGWKLTRWDDSPLPDDERPLSRAMREGAVHSNVTFCMCDASGGRHYLVAYAAPIRDGDGRTVGGVGVYTDETRRVLAERDLDALRERVARGQRLEGLGLLAGGIAHDFKNLLAAMRGQIAEALR